MLHKAYAYLLSCYCCQIISDNTVSFDITLLTQGNHTIDLLLKSDDAPVPYPTMHYFITEMYIFLLQNGVLWENCLMYCGVCGMV